VLALKGFSLQNSDKTSFRHIRKFIHVVEKTLISTWRISLSCERANHSFSISRSTKCNRHNRGLRMIQFYSSANMHSSRI